MKVLLLKDVYKLGRAGDVKRVAAGYGRNYLLPQGLAVLATPGAMKQADRIRKAAEAERIRLNQELGSLAEMLEGMQLTFPVKAGETGRLYGSITTGMLAEAINKEAGSSITKRQIDSQPIKSLGVHNIHVRLTVDLVPELTVVAHREGEPPESAFEIEEMAPEEVAETFVELAEELDQEEIEAEEAAAEAEEAAAEAEEAPAEVEALDDETGEDPQPDEAAEESSEA